MDGAHGERLPTGVVTFLLTDLEGSTSLWERAPEAMGPAVERHTELIEAAVAAHGGIFIRAKGEGDSTFSVFADPSDAVTAAAQLQGAMHREEWIGGVSLRTRAALYTGEADVRFGDYQGADVNRCARLRSIAHGGQVLLSRSTVERAVLSADATLRDLGSHGLRGLAQPEHVYQLCVEGVPDEFPPLSSVEAMRQNLPAFRTSFVGRTEERERLRDALRSHRLVTMTGVGGSGKTRLAVQVAVDLIEAFEQGVSFVDLTQVSEPTALESAIADALGVRGSALGGGASAWEEARRVLRQDATLLIIDNCEHIVDACAALVDDLLTECPPLRVLATSRESLGVDGESTFVVQPFELPDGEWAGSPAVQLFAERAKVVRPGFAVTPENADAVVEICRRLDGMPLAIELAAAQIAHMSPAQIAERLNDRFRLLSGGGRRTERQQTLGATLDWSYGLLSERERMAFRRLSVFPGSFSLEATEAVAGSDAIDDLRSLVRKSLVDTIEIRGVNRYRLLETVRLYAERKLIESDEVQAAREAHASFFTRVFGEPLTTVEDVLDPVFAASVVEEAHNIRGALRWSEDQPDRIARLALAAIPLWAGNAQEGWGWFTTALNQIDRLDPETQAHLLTGSAWCASHIGDYGQMRELAERAIALAPPDAPPKGWLASAHSFCAMIASFFAALGDEEARQRFEHHAAEADRLVAGMTSSLRGYLCLVLATSRTTIGDLEGGLRGYKDAIAAYENLEPDQNLVDAWNRIVVVLHLLGRDDENLHYAELAAEHADGWRVYSGSTDRGWDLLYQSGKLLALACVGRTEDAVRYAREISAGIDTTAVTAALLDLFSVFAAIAFRHGDVERASRLLVVAHREDPAAAASAVLYQAYRRKLRELIDRPTRERLRAEAEAMSREDALEQAMEVISGSIRA